MNSIRPLVTITILTIVAVFLFMKINEGPVGIVADSGLAPEAITPEETPPLEVPAVSAPAVGNAVAAESAAPAWPGMSPSAAVVAHSAEDAPVQVPAVPAIPELPGTTQLTDDTRVTSATEPAGLPDNIPVAQYPGESPVVEGNAGEASVGVATSPVARDVRNLTDEANAYATDSAMEAAGLVPRSDVGVPGVAAAPGAVAEPAPLNSSGASATAEAAGGTVAPTSSQAAMVNEPSFAVSWPVIQVSLERGELARAHQLLSQWYGDPSLTPAEREQVDTLLSQLAGTVVYSTEHQLEPAHVVQAGETLETIAAKYNVPWQLLAKINGVPSANAVQPGQQLKVMRGPFSAVVDLRVNELTLMLDGRYAGKFAIDGPVQAVPEEGEWQVVEKFNASRDGQVVRSLALEQPGEQPIYLGASRVDSAGGAANGAVVNLTPADAEEVTDILSVGSRVVIRR